MIENTINDDKTIAGGGEGAIPAGRSKIFCMFKRGGMVTILLA